MPTRALLERPRITRRSDGIDALRAVLALWVIEVHVAEWGPIFGITPPRLVRSLEQWEVSSFQSHGETNPAVLVFIVLSGYCIHRGGARLLGAWNTRGYAVKRFFRICPVFVAATAFAAIVFAAASRGTQGPEVESVTATTSITVGCLTAKLSGAAAFAPGLLQCSYEGNAPLNTVMVEIWLYVVYGLVAIALLRRLRDRMLVLLIAVATVAGIAFVRSDPASYANWWHNSSLLGFLPYWWIGAAFVGARPRLAAKVAVPAAAAWALLTWVMASTTLSAGNLFTVAELRKLAFALGAGCLICAIDAYANKLPRLVSGFGRSGYSLYAFHGPLLVAVLVLGGPWWLAVLVAIGVAALSYRFVERPLLLRGRAIARSLGTPSAVDEMAPSAAA